MAASTRRELFRRPGCDDCDDGYVEVDVVAVDGLHTSAFAACERCGFDAFRYITDNEEH